MLTSIKIDSIDAARRAAAYLQTLGPKTTIITLGADGIVVATHDQPVEHIAVDQVTAIDTTVNVPYTNDHFVHRVLVIVSLVHWHSCSHVDRNLHFAKRWCCVYHVLFISDLGASSITNCNNQRSEEWHSEFVYIGRSVRCSSIV